MFLFGNLFNKFEYALTSEFGLLKSIFIPDAFEAKSFEQIIYFTYLQSSKVSELAIFASRIVILLAYLFKL